MTVFQSRRSPRGCISHVRRPVGPKRQGLKLFVEQLQGRIAPATFTVLNLNDSGVGSLRQAVLDANAAAGADTIDFSGTGASGTIVLASSIALSSEIAIQGPGSGQLTVGGNNLVGLFAPTGADPISISDLTLAGGQATYGAAISNTAASLSLNNIVFTGNSATNGGAILNWDGSTLNVQNCTFDTNTATAGGGAVWNNNGFVTVANCTFNANTATDATGEGGALFNTMSGSFDVVACAFTANTAGQAGGAFFNVGTATIAGSSVVGNQAIVNGLTAGGGIINYSTGTMSMRDTTVSGNSSGTYGGGIFNGFGSTGGSLVMTNCTISGNSSDSGGGIYNAFDALLAASATTISGNSATTGGGIWNDSFDFGLANSIVVGNTLTSSTTVDNIEGFGAADTTRSRFNVIGAVSGTGFTNGVNNNQVGVSVAAANLGSLGNNGGSTQTMPLNAGSVAIHTGNATLANLNGIVDAASTTFAVADAYYLGVGQVVQVDNELMQITAVSGKSVTTLRAINGSTAVGHLSGASLVLPSDQRGVDRFPALPVDVGAYQTTAPFSIVTLLPNWTVNQAYDQTLLTTGGAGASTFQVTTGSLPAGLTLNPTSGEITGQPTAAGTVAFTVTATDAFNATTSKNYSLTINVAPTITTATLPDAFLNNGSYSQTISVSGGTAPAALSVISGALPAGLTLDLNTGVVSGALKAVGDYSFTVAAVDAAGAVATKAYTLRVVMTLTAQAQLGSEVYSGRVTGHVVAAQSNSYRLALAAGQKVSITAQTAPALQGTVQILNPSSLSIASATASAAGSTVFLQNVSAPVAGTYVIVLSGAGGTSGDFSLTFDLDVQRETEAAGAATNGTIATAENIGGSFYALNSLVSRGALSSSATYSGAAVAPAFQDISTTGTASTAAVGDDATDSLTSGQIAGFTFPFFGTTYTAVSFSTNGLITFGSANSAFANVDLSAAVGAPSQASIAPLWGDLAVNGPGAVYWQVVGTGPSQQLVVQWNNVHLVGATDLFTFQAVLSVDGSIQFNYGAGLTAGAIAGSTVGIKDAGLGNGASVVANVNGMQPLGTLVAAGQSVRFTPAASGADYYSFTMNAGDVASVSLAAAGAVTVDLRDGSDAVLATGVSGPTNLTAIIDRYVATTTATYYVRVAGDSKVAYTVAVAKNAAFDEEPNDSFATAQNITGAQGVVGYLESGSTSNGYAVTSPTYGFVDISVPGAGAAISDFLPENGNYDDNAVQLTFPTGFQVPFYGTSYSSIFISTNGLLTFGTANSSADNGNFSTAPTQAAIAPFWDDLVVDGRVSSRVYYAIVGSGASQQLIVQWNNLSFYDDYTVNGPQGGLTFQAILGVDGSIRFNYQSLTTGNNGGIDDEGLGATAGIKAAGGLGNVHQILIGDLTHPAGPTALVGSGKSVLITPNRGPDWYAITLSGSQSNLRVTTSTPGDNANQWANPLNPKIDVYDSSNALIASGTAGPDGRNESLLLTGLTPGATYKIRVLGEGSYGEYFLGASATGAPAVTSVTPNGGPIVARDRFGLTPSLGPTSSVEQLLVTFNQLVTLDANAFSVVNLSGSVTALGASPSGASVSVTATGVPGTGDSVNGYSQYVLTFSGAGVNSFDNSTSGGAGNAFTTLKDGFYQLQTAGAHVHVGSVTAADRNDNFWSLYGANAANDIQVTVPLGDGNDTLLVDGLALNEMYSSFGSNANAPSGPPVYRPAYDWNLDGHVDGIDLSHLYANFGTIWRF